MKVAIMQPYLFPYLGYFQLISAVDKFVFLDDANFIKQGWINRNRLLVNGRTFMFTVPTSGPSSFKRIDLTAIHSSEYAKWVSTFLKTVRESYKKAPFFDDAFPVVERAIEAETQSLAELCKRTVNTVCSYLHIGTHIIDSSSIYENRHLKGQERVIDICRRESATEYINSSGGAGLYDRDEFARHEITLRFLRSKLPPYVQFGKEFTPALSIIDVLMFNSPTDTSAMLDEFELF